MTSMTASTGIAPAGQWRHLSAQAAEHPQEAIAVKRAFEPRLRYSNKV